MSRPGPLVKSLTKIFLVILVVFSTARVFFASRPLVDGGDGFKAIMPLQVIGIREAVHGNFWWTDDLGLGYPLLNELDFQQLNPLNLLYLVIDPLRAFHVQVVVWIALLALSAWVYLRRIFPTFGELECTLYLALVLGGTCFRYAMAYQVVFLSSFAILPFAWFQIRKIFAQCRPLDLALLAGATLLLVHSQYNFTLVPNFLVLGLMTLYEFSRSEADRRRKRAVFVTLSLLFGGFLIFHVFDILEIHRLSNRKEDLSLEGTGWLAKLGGRLSLPNLTASLEGMFGFPEWRFLISLLVITGIVRVAARRRAIEPVVLHAPLLVMVGVLCGFGLVVFDAPRHLTRMAVITLFPAAIWFALVGGEFATRIAVLFGHASRARALLTAATTLGLGGTFYCFDVDVELNYPPPFGRLHEVAGAIDDMFGGALPEDLRRYRVGSVIEDDFKYTHAFLPRSLYQPSQAVLYGFRETGFYGSYLINGGQRSRTYEQIVTTQRFGTFGNITALTKTGVSEPILRLLNVKYLVSHETLEAKGLALRNTIPARDPPGFARQYLYTLQHPLPRAWAVPLPQDLAAELEGRSFSEASDRIETFIGESLDRGSIDVSLCELALERSGRSLRLSGLGRVGQPALVFVSMPYWPAWAPTQQKVRAIAPFGLTALIVPDPSDAITLEFRLSAWRWKVLGASSILAAMMISIGMRRRFGGEGA